MSALWTAAEAARATGGELRGDWSAQGVSIDTRSLSAGDLFVALKDKRDGHEFVAKAFEKGAAAALVSRIPPDLSAKAPLLIVPDVLAALGALGRAARARTSAKVIAVTGSVGKTGTKEMLRLALAPQGRVHAAEKSFNNHWGLPLTLARMPENTEFAVLEIGMNAPGEIAPLARLARPHVAIITAVAAVHQAAFADLRAIAREKAAIFEGLEPGGSAILNRDDESYPMLLRKARAVAATPVRFGRTGRPEFPLRRVFVSQQSTRIETVIGGHPLRFKLSAPGAHLAMNALAALAAIQSVGADIELAALALVKWQAPEGRGSRWQVGLGAGEIDGRIILIDESYNANPRSVEAAFEVLAATRPTDNAGRAKKGRRIALLSDMLELGPDEAKMHKALARISSLTDIDLVHTAGPLMKNLHAALPARQRGHWYETSVELAADARRLVDAGDVVMVKGSLGSRAALIVDAVKKLGDARMQDAG